MATLTDATTTETVETAVVPVATWASGNNAWLWQWNQRTQMDARGISEGGGASKLKYWNGSTWVSVPNVHVMAG